MQDTFSKFHPIINIAFFLTAVVSTMMFFDVYFVPLSFLAAFSYGLFIGGKKFIKMVLIFVLPVVILSTAFNMYLNQTGDTIIFQYKYTIITMEAALYGLVSGLAFGSILMWFYSYNAVVTSDKFLFVFGKIMPTLALVFSMVLRFIPLFTKRANLIVTGQKAIGKDPGSGTKKEKTRHGIKILSIMITWSLENSIDTSDSMKARGYGLKGRTTYSNFKFTYTDGLVAAVLTALIIIIFAGIPNFGTTIFFYPYIEVVYNSLIWPVIYICAGIFCFLPLLLNLKEAVQWKYLESKI